MKNSIEITLIGKPGCHLCDAARIDLASVIGNFGSAHPETQIVYVEKDILQEAALAAKHSEEIPVVLVNGAMHSYWRVDPDRLQARLESLI